ncbi:MAG TPA: FAD-dependent monooxygenase [Phycisphaerales bacterium]|nr:FAD-dependent monooxygenase [Phycisphaerales bacterium]
MSKHVVIVGAGLAGSLLAVSLARRGWRVSVYERRGDPRARGYVGGRSINLAVSARGIAGLASVGLDREILEGHAIPMPGRMVHAKDGSTIYVPYSKNPSDAINSFSRGGLNLALIHAAAREKSVNFHFDHPCADIDFAAPAAIFARGGTGMVRVEADLIVGADGAFSAVRMAMQKTDRFDYSQSYLGHGYKELSIPPEAAGQMRVNALHIWPRGGAMMIALPNTDGSFTSTLFWPFEGEHSFAGLEGSFSTRRGIDPSAQPTRAERERVHEFFTAEYPDAVGHMPTLVDDFFRNPTSSLVTVRCAPWHRGGKVVLLGDAAHAIVPFYGQGMNAAFEDVISLSRELESTDDQTEAVERYFADRKPNADSIADMAIENFIEMRDRVGSPEFRYHKKLEQAIHERFEHEVTPRYNLVSFSTVPYTEARRRGDMLDRIVTEVGRRLPISHGLDERSWRECVERHAAPLIHELSAGKPAPIHLPGLIDLSPVITRATKVWPGDTPPTRQVLCELEKGASVTLSTLHTTVHLGTHADGPNHYGVGAPSIEAMPLRHYHGPCTVIEAGVERGRRVRIEDAPGASSVSTPIALVRTGTFDGVEVFNEDFAGLSVELVDLLASRGVITIGVDTPSVDLFSSKDLEAHRAILRHGIAIIEGLVLRDLEAGAVYEFTAMPLALEGFDASPVRAAVRRM